MAKHRGISEDLDDAQAPVATAPAPTERADDKAPRPCCPTSAKHTALRVFKREKNGAQIVCDNCGSVFGYVGKLVDKNGKMLVDESTAIKKNRRQRVYARACPKNPNHTKTRVVKTVGRVRYCICDECGHPWQQDGPLANEEVKNGE